MSNNSEQGRESNMIERQHKAGTGRNEPLAVLTESANSEQVLTPAYLRHWASSEKLLKEHPVLAGAMGDAADEIERLRTENTQLQASIDRVYVLLVEDRADEKTDRKLLAEVTNKLADVAT